MLSGRLDWEIVQNDLATALARIRGEGRPVSDLTISNPTRCGLRYPDEALLDALTPNPSTLLYAPEPNGLLQAREAVSRYYRAHGAAVGAGEIVLTSSTSEAYGYLFKLLCRAGDEVLVPQPSYPLFDFLATLDAVRPVAYPLFFHDGWRIDFGALEQALTSRSRAILVVHPNNPTGSYVSVEDRERLIALVAERGLALVADEVFLDFPLAREPAARSLIDSEQGLVFALGGLSKLAGLPQLKLSWMAVGGAPPRRAEALLGLEHIADHYLSVGTPVQLATPRLLEIAPGIRDAISQRTRENLARLEAWTHSESAVTLLAPEGGWYASLRLPAIQSSEAWALDLLETASVYLHPGSVFGFQSEAFVVVSLLTPPAVFEHGIREAFRVVFDRMRPRHG